MRLLIRAIALMAFVSALLAGPSTVRAQDTTDQEPEPSRDQLQWPRVIEDDGITLSVYQPQVDRFDAESFEARAAIQVETPAGDKTQTSYGVIWIQAHPSIDKEAGLVQLDDIQITKANFPTAGAAAADQYLEILRRNSEPSRTVSLERIEANLAVTQADKKGNAVPLKNDPPKIYYRTSPAILLLIDGDPVLRPVQGSNLQRVINTRSLILQDGNSYLLPMGGRWMTARTATGPWTLSAGVSPAVQSAKDSIAKDENQTQVDLLEDPGEDIEALLERGKAPEIIVSTVPAELLLTQGKPEMKPIAGTQLLYVSNTTGDILLDLKTQSYYVPLTGRWYRAKSLDGPWKFVDGDDLPKDFEKIPTNNPKASVLATVPGTPAAQEAVIANSIPQTAEVNREEAKFEPAYDGDPRFDNVPDTQLQYAVNSPTPIVRVSPTSYYAVQGGVWFTAGAPIGPWIVATAVPPVIYTIPTASPIHYVTYVRIYRYNPTYVWVGYTPGYMGTCYSPWGTVVYGTGWHYRPWIGTYWYGAPMTWGFGVGISWSPWTGWDVGFGWGGYRPVYRPWWGPYYGWRPYPRPPYPYPGRPVYGRPVPYPRTTVNINNINVYNRPGVTRPGVRPAVQPARPAPPAGARPVPGTRPAPQSPSGRPVTTQPSTRPAPGRQPSTRPARPDNVYAGPDGNVYRPRDKGGWETNDGGQWKPVQPSRPQTRPAPEAQPARPSRPAPQTRPGSPERSVDPSTLNQLSRDQRGRQYSDARMNPPASTSRPSTSSRQPSSPQPRSQPQTRQPPKPKS